MCVFCEPSKHGICKPLVKKGLGFGTPLVDMEVDENTHKLEMLVHYDGEEPTRLSIKFCPICGQPLKDKYV